MRSDGVLREIIPASFSRLVWQRGGHGRRVSDENVPPIELKGEQPGCPRSCMWHWLLESQGY